MCVCVCVCMYIYIYIYIYICVCVCYFSAPGRKKKIVEEVKPTTELPHPAEVSALTTENSTSAATVDSLSFSPVIDQPTVADITKPLSHFIPADDLRLTTAIELHTSSASDERVVRTSCTAEQPSSSASVKARPAAIMAETSAEANSQARPVHVLSTSEIAVGLLSPCHTVQVFEEETRMSAESGSRSQTPARALPVAGMKLTECTSKQTNCCKEEGVNL